MNISWNRTRARVVYWISGKLSRIKTSQRVWGWNEETKAFDVDDGYRKLPCVISIILLEKSMDLDPAHWDHWALRHDDCHRVPCPDCGGCDCTDYVMEDNP